MVSMTYSAQRSALAKKLGLAHGTHGEEFAGGARHCSDESARARPHLIAHTTP